MDSRNRTALPPVPSRTTCRTDWWSKPCTAQVRNHGAAEGRIIGADHAADQRCEYAGAAPPVAVAEAAMGTEVAATDRMLVSAATDAARANTFMERSSGRSVGPAPLTRGGAGM